MYRGRRTSIGERRASPCIHWRQPRRRVFRGCRAAIFRGHRVVGLPCGQRTVMHAWCVVEAIHATYLRYVHIGVQPAMGYTNHWRRQFRLILDSALWSRVLEEGNTTAGANRGKG